MNKATVFVFALPNQQTLDATSEGNQTTMLEVGWARTDKSGNFSIPVTAGALPADVVDNQGNTNLEVVATAGNRQLTYYYPVHYNSDNSTGSPVGWVATSDTTTSDTTPSLALDMGKGTATNTPDNPTGWLDETETPLTQSAATNETTVAVSPETSTMQNLSNALPTNISGASIGGTGSTTLTANSSDTTTTTTTTASPATSASATPDSVDRCYLQKTSNVYYNKKEHFLTAYTATGFPETVTESATATHTLGVAVKDGSTGVWGYAGTMSISRNASNSASQTYYSSHTVFNRVNYRDWQNTCSGQTVRKPDGFYDFLTADGVSVNEVWFYNCGRHAAGSGWDTSTASNVTYGGGVDLAILNLSAHSGYASSLNLHYAFNQNGEVCGNDVNGPLSSSQVEADEGGW